MNVTLDFSVFCHIVIPDMKVKFINQATVDFMDHRDDVLGCNVSEKTFYRGQIVEVASIDETVNGFVDLVYENGDIAVGVPKRGLTIL